MDRPVLRRGRQRVAAIGDCVPSGNGSARPFSAGVPGVQRSGATHPLRGERNELLRALPDRWPRACRSRHVAAPQGRLAAIPRRAVIACHAVDHADRRTVHNRALQRRARDSNPDVLADAGFQDRCNSHSANPPKASPTAEISPIGEECTIPKRCDVPAGRMHARIVRCTACCLVSRRMEWRRPCGDRDGGADRRDRRRVCSCHRSRPRWSS